MPGTTSASVAATTNHNPAPLPARRARNAPKAPGGAPSRTKSDPGTKARTTPVKLRENSAIETRRRPERGSLTSAWPPEKPSKTRKWLKSQNRMAGQGRSRSPSGSLR